MAFRDGATSLLLSRSYSNILKHLDVMSCSWSEDSCSGLSPWERYVTKDGCLRKTLQASVTRLFSQNCSITQKLLFHCHESLSKATRPGTSLMRTWNTNASSGNSLSSTVIRCSFELLPRTATYLLHYYF